MERKIVKDEGDLALSQSNMYPLPLSISVSNVPPFALSQSNNPFYFVLFRGATHTSRNHDHSWSGLTWISPQVTDEADCIVFLRGKKANHGQSVNPASSRHRYPSSWLYCLLEHLQGDNRWSGLN